MPALGDFKLACTFGLAALYLHYRDVRFPYMTFRSSDKKPFQKMHAAILKSIAACPIFIQVRPLSFLACRKII